MKTDVLTGLEGIVGPREGRDLVTSVEFSGEEEKRNLVGSDEFLKEEYRIGNVFDNLDEGEKLILAIDCVEAIREGILCVGIVPVEI
jgi:hypothetical protein